LKVVGPPILSMAPSDSSSGSAALLKNCASFVVPVRPPSALAPLSDQRVLELPDGAEEAEKASDVMIGVRQEPGEHLHHAGVQPALVI
jgi:hypothetical protein